MERLFQAKIVDGALQPFDLVGWTEALHSWPHKILWVALQDEQVRRTSAQNRYWWSVVVPTVGQCWQHEKKWDAPPAREVIHGALVKAVFGTVDTPLGPERKSSRDLTLQQFTELIDWTRDYCWTRYRVRIPEAHEVEG